MLRAGNVTFTPDGDSLISPVGNRVTVFNLASSTSVTLPFEHVKGVLSAVSASAREPPLLLVSQWMMTPTLILLSVA
jgi:periodic tryptophan protein 2